MAIDKIFNDGNVDGIADNIFNAVNNSVSEVKQMQQRKAAENAQMVVQSLKKIDTDIRNKFDNVTDVLEKRIITIKDGRDGINGKDGRDGKDGKNGRDGKDGAQGPQGPKGQDGLDGIDGVSVTNANIDFDGSLIINLSSGVQINAGEVVSPELEKKIIAVTKTGGSSGAIGDVRGPASSTDNAVSRFDGTTGKLIQNSVVIIDDTGNMSGVGTLNASGGAVIQGLTVGRGASAIADNTGVGVSALAAITTGISNTAIGWQSSKSMLAGNDNTGCGLNTLRDTLNGYSNTAVGSQTMQFNTSGHSNTAVGNTALLNNLTGYGNTGIGYAALNTSTGNNNVGVGASALGNTTGNTNTAIGTGAGQMISTGSNNVVIGAYNGSAAPISATGSNYIVLSDGAGTVRQTIDSSGNVGIGTTVPAAKLDVAGNTIISTTDNTNAALRITQLGTGNALLVEDSTNPDASPLVVSNSGQLIVGYTAAVGAAQNTNIQSQSTGGTAGFTAFRWSNDITPPRLQVGKSRGAAIGTNAIVQLNDQLGGVYFYGDDGTDLVSTAASIVAEVDGTPGLNDMPGRLTFNTTNDGSQVPTERVRIDSTGQTKFSYNVVVEVTDNTNAALRITQLGTGNALLVEDSTNPDATPFVVTNTGVIVGGNTSALDGYAGVTTRQSSTFEAIGGNSAGTGLAIFGFATATASPRATVNFNKSQSTTIGTQTIVTSDEVLGGIHFNGSDGTNYIPAAQIYGVTDGTPGTNDMPGRLVFSTTADGSSSPTERMRIDSSGNVLVTNAAGLGYGTGAGGTVTQATSRTTGVTLSKPTGAITMFSAAGSATAATFTVTNTLVAATDTIILNQKSGTNLYVLLVTAVAAGSFNVTFYTTGGTATDAPVINFSLIKGVTA